MNESVLAFAQQIIDQATERGGRSRLSNEAARALNAAIAKIEPANGIMNERLLVETLAGELFLAVAQSIVNRATQRGATEPNGVLHLPGLPPHPYEPDRLLRNDSGHIVRQQFATPEFKRAEVAIACLVAPDDEYERLELHHAQALATAIAICEAQRADHIMVETDLVEALAAQLVTGGRL